MDTILKLIKDLVTRLEILERSRGGSEDWIDLPLVNSWVVFDTTYNTPQYYKDRDGIVHLKGLIKSGSTGAIATLPAGYRPSRQCLFVSITNPNVIGRIDITTAGVITASVYSNVWISLDGISFRV